MKISMIWLLLLPIPCLSQSKLQPDAREPRATAIKWKNFRVPVILIGAGLLAATDNEVFDKWEIYDARNRISPHFHTTVDNYIQFAPIAGVYALDLFGVQGRDDIWNQTVCVFKSEVLMAAAVFSIKHLTAADRPDTEIDTSFPSGHTAQAFAAATILHHEFGSEHPWIAILGYTTATGVGVLRVMNNKHWISDVLVGAGIGILSTNLVYSTHQNRWGRGLKNRFTTRLSPFYQHQTRGICLNIAIR